MEKMTSYIVEFVWWDNVPYINACDKIWIENVYQTQKQLISLMAIEHDEERWDELVAMEKKELVQTLSMMLRWSRFRMFPN